MPYSMGLNVERLPTLVTERRGVSEANLVELTFKRSVGEMQGQETEQQILSEWILLIILLQVHACI